jgi:hypothetical protein
MTSITTAEMTTGWHGGAADVGPANRHGRPEVVAPALRSLFAQP